MHIYTEIKFGKFGEGQNCTIFTKIGTKLRQKLKY